MNPDLEAFRRLAQDGNVAPVWKALTADLETPVSAYLKLAEGRKFSFLLESVEGGERIARYTYLGADPFLKVTAKGSTVEIEEGGRRETREGSVFDVLRELVGRYKPVHVEGLPPFTAGAVGYAGFDLVRLIEPRVPEFRVQDSDAPDAVFLFFSTLLAFDHAKHQILAIANVRTDEHEDLDQAYAEACAQIEDIERLLARPTPLPPKADSHAPLEVRSNFTREEFCAAVEKAKEYILAGDIFQVVLSQRLEMEPGVAPFQIYRALRAVNPFSLLVLPPARRSGCAGQLARDARQGRGARR
ncbi:MAG: chorismate-binding protein [Bryobacterales bacterium]